MLTREQARAITDRVLTLSRADETFVSLGAGVTSHFRFARNGPSTSGSSERPDLRIEASFGKRTGAVTINQFDDRSIAEAVRRAEEVARLAPEDPESVPVLGPQSYGNVPAFDAPTAERGAESLVDWVGTCVGQASKAGVVAAGYAETWAGMTCVASSKGLFGYHASTNAYLATTARTPDGTGSGWAQAASHRIGDIDAGAVASAATAKARASIKPRPLTPGKYVTILEPACVASLVRVAGAFMNGRAADEGRSYFSAPSGKNRIGEKLFDERVTVISDPGDARVPGTPWSNDGLPDVRRTWIEKGVLRNLMVERYWAGKSGVAPVPQPSNLIMAGGQGSVDDLVASTERGVLVTSLWYIRVVDPRTLLLTGITRDGVFWIENGKIAHPVQNLRWNDSPLTVLSRLDALSAAVSMPPRGNQSADTVVPAVRVKEFNFTSVSEAV